MKKIYFGVFAVAIALGTSAFTSVKDINTFGLPIEYHNVFGDGTLIKELPTGTCSTPNTYRCSYIFQNPDNISHSQLPAQIQYNDTTLGTVTPQGPSALCWD